MNSAECFRECNRTQGIHRRFFQNSETSLLRVLVSAHLRWPWFSVTAGSSPPCRLSPLPVVLLSPFYSIRFTSVSFCSLRSSRFGSLTPSPVTACSVEEIYQQCGPVHVWGFVLVEAVNVAVSTVKAPCCEVWSRSLITESPTELHGCLKLSKAAMGNCCSILWSMRN
ncbi:uncharacterized protein G2W53_011045 [Senna tora]|uniref:Uncharacterized protein n=1 Tax=Senna tora TaxID=362788 RepID=A0A835CA63_9FABA|nr:uncharacterized protein G2W53_011045 [Senna tora]